MDRDRFWGEINDLAASLEESTTDMTRDRQSQLLTMAMEGIDLVFQDLESTNSPDLYKYNTCQRIIDLLSNSEYLIQIDYQLNLVASLLNKSLVDLAVEQLKVCYLMIQRYIYNKDIEYDSIKLVDIINGFHPLSNSPNEMSIISKFLIRTINVIARSSKVNKTIGLTHLELTNSLSSNSMFDQILLSCPQNKDFMVEMVQSLIQLSLHTKTAYKLTFLILALKYGSYMGQVNRELLLKICTDCEKMMQKNENVVYKLTSRELFDMLSTCKINDVDMNILYPIIDKFSTISKTLKVDDLDWQYFKPQKIEIVSTSEFQSLKSPRELSNIYLKLKNCDFDSTNDQLFILSTLEMIHSFLSNKSNDSTKVVGLLDFITIKLQKVLLENIQFTSNAISILSDIFSISSRTDQRRLRNIATLHFSLGNKLIEIGNNDGLALFKSCAKIEFSLLNSFNDYDKFIKRMNQISYSLTNNHFMEVSLPFLMRSFEVWFEKKYHGDILTLDSCLLNDMGTTLKLLTKSISATCQFQLLIGNFKYPELCIGTLINVIKMITLSSIPNKESIISKAILSIKDSFTDNGLFLYFLSKIFFIIEFNINFKSDEFEFESESVSYSIKSLILCHLNSLSVSLNGLSGEMLLISLKKIKQNILDWLQIRGNTEFTQYEFDVVDTVVNTLKYHNLNLWGIDILQVYLKGSGYVMDQEFKNQLNVKLANLYLSSYQFRNFIEISKFISPDMINDPFLKIKMMISLLEYNILTNNPNVQNDLITVFQILKHDPNFTVSNQKDKYVVVELLIILARFSHVVSKYHKFISNDYVESVSNLKREIKILQSIMKNFILTSEKSLKFSMNFKSTLKLIFSENIMDAYSTLTDTLLYMGSCKEFEFYFNELETFTQSQPSSILKFKFNLEFTKHQISLDSRSKVDSLFDKIMGSSLDLDGIVDDIFKLSILSTMEKYYSFKNDYHLASESVIKFDTFMNTILNSSINGIDSKYLTDIWIENIGRRLNSSKNYNSEVWINYFKETKNEHALALSLYDRCSNLILNKPKFSNSGISYPFSKCDINEEDESINEIVEILRECSVNYSRAIDVNFQKIPVDILKNDINKLITCFVNLLRFDGKNNRIDSVISVSDKFKYLPFIYERGLSLYGTVDNDVLPNIDSLSISQKSIKTSGLNLLANILPRNWISVSIDYNSITNSFRLVKHEFGYDQPLVFEISLNEKVDFDSVILDLLNIIRESEVTTSPDVTSKVSTKEQKIEWWDTRKKLDSSLRDLLVIIENDWFGGFNSLFNTKKLNVGDVQNIRSFLKKWINKSNNDLDCIEKFDELDNRLFELLLKITSITKNKVKDILKVILDPFLVKYGPEMINLDKLSVELVKIIQLLSSPTGSESKEIDHIFIIPGPESVSIPWESIPSLRNVSISRFPTAKHLIDRLINEKSLIQNGVSSENGYYIINPGGDLSRTEEILGPKFKELASWNGSIGVKPLESEIINSFKNSNLYIYAGHGGGEQYIRSSIVKQQDVIPPTLLFGCSSGKLKGKLFPYGTPYNYIMGGCPSLLVNLWDVTDKDTDLFTMSVLKEWGLLDDGDSMVEDFFESDVKTLGECVTKGREACKLKYLNGAAPVLHGLPLTLG